jgi:hypothetical protein
MVDKMYKTENEEDLANVAGGGDGWFGRDGASDKNDIGGWSEMSWHSMDDDYCLTLKGYHDYDTGRVEVFKDENNRYYIKRYCKCGRYIIDKR